MSGEEMALADLLRDYRDGDERGWQDEFDWLDTNHAAQMDLLTTSVQEDGIREPILLGDDGRVWDGHHRIAVAHRLALTAVPVRHAAEPTPAEPDAGEVEALTEAEVNELYRRWQQKVNFTYMLEGVDRILAARLDAVRRKAGAPLSSDESDVLAEAVHSERGYYTIRDAVNTILRDRAARIGGDS